MFAYCDKCGWDSGDAKDRYELQRAVEEAGGHLALGDQHDDEADRCPKCGSSNLHVD